MLSQPRGSTRFNVYRVGSYIGAGMVIILPTDVRCMKPKKSDLFLGTWGGGVLYVREVIKCMGNRE